VLHDVNANINVAQIRTLRQEVSERAALLVNELLVLDTVSLQLRGDATHPVSRRAVGRRVLHAAIAQIYCRLLQRCELAVAFVNGGDSLGATLPTDAGEDAGCCCENRHHAQCHQHSRQSRDTQARHCPVEELHPHAAFPGQPARR
jgi:hypothetical protein